MLRKIISSGRNGAARAAIDVAVKLSIPHGGWVRGDRLTENDSTAGPCPHRDARRSSDEEQTELNVADSDGTLVIARGPLNGTTVAVREAAWRHRKPWLYIDLAETDAFHASFEIGSWIIKNGIEVLNVTGPQGSGDKDVYPEAKSILEVVAHLIRFDIEIPAYASFVDFKKRLDPARLPKTVDDVVELLLSDLSLKDKFAIAKLEAEEIAEFSSRMVHTIVTEFRLDTGNEDLLRSCGELGDDRRPTPEEAAVLIIARLLNAIKKIYCIRAVK